MLEGDADTEADGVREEVPVKLGDGVLINDWDEVTVDDSDTESVGDTVTVSVKD